MRGSKTLNTSEKNFHTKSKYFGKESATKLQMFLHRLHVYRTPARITAAVELCITSNISGVSVFQITLADIVVSLNEVC